MTNEASVREILRREARKRHARRSGAAECTEPLCGSIGRERGYFFTIAPIKSMGLKIRQICRTIPVDFSPVWKPRAAQQLSWVNAPSSGTRASVLVQSVSAASYDCA